MTDVTQTQGWCGGRADGIGNRLNGVIVKEHGGNGFVINGTGTSLTTCEVEARRARRLRASRGAGPVLSGSTATEARHGFIVSGPATCERRGRVQPARHQRRRTASTATATSVTGAGASLKNNDAQGNVLALAYRIGALARARTRRTPPRTMPPMDS
mgnify:CR=1 FL=1